MKRDKESSIEFTTSEGVEFGAHLVRVGRFEAVFNMFGPANVLRASQVLTKLKIVTGGTVLYDGRATVSNVVTVPDGITCQVDLDDPGIHVPLSPEDAPAAFQQFQRQWLPSYKIPADFKVIVADVEILLSNLRHWFGDLALSLYANTDARTARREHDLLQNIAPRAIQSFNAFHERFEELAYKIPPEARGIHRNYVWRQWSQFFLCAPFGHRTYYKPLGYAGDYEMMNMIHRNAPEGASLFAKAMHLLLVSQWPAESVRNRIAHLKIALVNETARVAREGRRARILNLGCGPAWEMQEFLRDTALSNEADFTLMDFNEETLMYAGGMLAEKKRSHGRRSQVEMRQASVQQLLRGALQGKSLAAEQRYDLIYCAGLFDYFSDATCRAIVKLFYGWLQPGGLVLVANMNDSKPFRNFIEFLLDWHLVYRDSLRVRRFAADTPASEATVVAEPTAVNLFLEVRKGL